MKYFTSFVVALTFLIGVEHAGCGTLPAPVPSSPSADTTETLKQFLLRHEKSFDPSGYEIPFTIVTHQADSSSTNIPIEAPSTDSLLFTSGYRVQVLTTPDIDRANQVKDSIGVLFPLEWSYIVYEMPYYKVRVGNFQDRASANRMLRSLSEKGLQDAWVVPDEIVKNPPIKFPPVPIPIDTMQNH